MRCVSNADAFREFQSLEFSAAQSSNHWKSSLSFSCCDGEIVQREIAAGEHPVDFRQQYEFITGVEFDGWQIKCNRRFVSNGHAADFRSVGGILSQEPQNGFVFSVPDARTGSARNFVAAVLRSHEDQRTVAALRRRAVGGARGEKQGAVLEARSRLSAEAAFVDIPLGSVPGHRAIVAGLVRFGRPDLFELPDRFAVGENDAAVG